MRLITMLFALAASSLAASNGVASPWPQDGVRYQCELQTYQRTQISIAVADESVLQPAWPIRQSPNTDAGNVSIETNNDKVLNGKANLIKFVRYDDHLQSAEIKIVRPGGVSIVVLVLSLQKESSGRLGLTLTQIGFHGERIPRGTGFCIPEELK